MRKETRMTILLPVRISGVDASGCQFDEEACALDVSCSGARIAGVQRSLSTGSTITLHRGPYCADYEVLWTGEGDGAEGGQLGVRLMENGHFIWGLVLRRMLAFDADEECEIVMAPEPEGSSQPQAGI